jgi:hypothetical protein
MSGVVRILGGWQGDDIARLRTVLKPSLLLKMIGQRLTRMYLPTLRERRRGRAAVHGGYRSGLRPSRSAEMARAGPCRTPGS